MMKLLLWFRGKLGFDMVTYYSIARGLIYIVKNNCNVARINVASIRCFDEFPYMVYIYYDGVSDKKCVLDFPQTTGDKNLTASEFSQQLQDEMVRLNELKG